MKRMKFMMILFIVSLSLSSLSCLAAIPNLEGLFRNGNNKEISGDMVSFRFIVEQISQQSELVPKSEEVPEVQMPIENDKKYVKIIFSLENDNRIDAVQIEYSDAGMETNSAIRSLYIPDFNKKVATDTKLDRAIVYSLLSMFVLNDGKNISSLLKKICPDFEFNSEKINQDKMDLLNQYKKYLSTINAEPDLKEELISPLVTEDEEEDKRIKELLSSDMYFKSDKVKLVRDGNRFFWKVTLNMMRAEFSNDKHHLKRLVLNQGDGTLKVDLSDYVLFNGVQELPKEMIFQTENQDSYKIQMVRLASFKNGGKSLLQRAEKYREIIRKNMKHDKELKQSQDIKNPIKNDKTERPVASFLLY